MQYIPTPSATVDTLKKQTKKLQHKAGGKHADLLDRVAKGAGHLHWHHVTLCLRQPRPRAVSKRYMPSAKSFCALPGRASTR